jgi:eukaryotic-like serine/threonine-protein kinase
MTRRKRWKKVLGDRRFQTMAGIVLAVVFVYFLFDSIAMPLYTRQGSERAVPKLIGLDRTGAIRAAKSAGFTVIEEPAKVSLNASEGSIIEQHPFAGSLAKPGRKIHIIPALPAPPGVAPDMTGLELRDAQLRCKNVGLISSESDTRYRFSERVPKGTVMGQDPSAGKPVEPGGVLKLVVSLGPMPSHFYVPYLMEKQLRDARGLLRDSGLKLGKIVKKETDQYASGTVIAQSVKSGDEVAQDTAIDVVVAVAKGGAE